jgi:hypothetical protein
VNFAFDHRIKYYGYIEIDSIPFRDGKFLMQKANKKNNFIESYTINFVGNLVQLKDKFKEDKLNVLDGYEELNFEYNINNVVAVSRPNIKFPLIASDRRYEYMTGTSSDITTNAGAIYYTDLFPAIRVSKIFEYIEATYDLNFQGDFLTYTQFKDLFLYCKNAEQFKFFSEPQSPNFTSESAGFTEFDLALGECTISFDLDPLANRLESWIKVEPTDPTIKYTVEIFDNGVLYATYADIEGDSDLGYYSKVRQQENTINGQYVTRRFTYKITSDLPMTYDCFINLKRNFSGTNWFYRTAYSYANTTSGDLQIRKYIPDLTVEAFVTAIVKAMNLVVIPINENTFEFQPLEAFYQEGRIVDLSEYIQAEDIEVNKPNLFRQISFKYEKSDNILNTNYRNRENQDYGDLIFDNPNSAYTTNYEIKLPFENMMWERYTDTTFITATCWNINLQPYVPKPVLMYFNGGQILSDDPIKYTANGTTFNVETTYPRFTNEINLGGSDLAYLQTLNWGDEISTWHLSSAPTGLFQKYYSNSIFNIYNQRTRVIKAKAQLDTYWLTSLKLNDRIVVSNKRYLINTMTTDLTTGQVDFELINDFRDIQGAVARRYSNIQNLEVDNLVQNIEVQLYRIDFDYFNVVASGGFLSYPFSSNNDTDIILKLTVPANTSGVDRESEIALQYYKNGDLTEVKIPVAQYA